MALPPKARRLRRALLPLLAFLCCLAVRADAPMERAAPSPAAAGVDAGLSVSGAPQENTGPYPTVTPETAAPPTAPPWATPTRESAVPPGGTKAASATQKPAGLASALGEELSGDGEDGFTFSDSGATALSPPPGQNANTAAETPPGPAPEPTEGPDYAYETDAVRAEIWEFRSGETVYFAVELWLTDPSQLRSAFSQDRFDAPTESVKDIADRNNAALAINGDFATFNNGGIIIRNGELFRSNKSTRQLLVIDAAGDFHAYLEPPQEPKEAAAAFLEQGVWQTLVFGPALVIDGMAAPLPEKFFINTRGAVEPRTAIAQLGPLHYLWLVVDGRQDGYSRGMSLSRLQELCLEFGAVTAFNLDGGGSTTLYYNGYVINRPANGGQRHVPDILYIPK